MAAPFYHFVEQRPRRTSAYEVLAEVRKRGLRSMKGVGDTVSMNVLKLLGMVMTAAVMIGMRGGSTEWVQETILMRGDNASAVAWMK